MVPSALLAHQGGWDEILLVLAPIAVILGLLLLAKHRVERAAAHGRPDGDVTPDVGPGEGGAGAQPSDGRR